MFQLILPFQLELPFDGPEAARGAARVRRARVRGQKGRLLHEMGQASAAPMPNSGSRADPRASTAE